MHVEICSSRGLPPLTGKYKIKKKHFSITILFTSWQINGIIERHSEGLGVDYYFIKSKNKVVKKQKMEMKK